MNPKYKSIKTIIVDDEIAFINTMKVMMQAHEDFDIIGYARSVEEAKELIGTTEPDLIFLDVKMEDGTGFDLLRSLDNFDFHIIFVTAFDQYALEAFKFSAVDYLLKPVVSSDLQNALTKVRTSIEKNHLRDNLQLLLSNLNQPLKEKRKIVIKEIDIYHVLELDEILWCQADGSYTKFFLTNGKSILVSRNLKEFEDTLKDAHFFRSHRSHLVNLNKIKTFEKSEGSILYLDGGYAIPVSFRKKDKLAWLLSQL